jgi:hypothetical protein
MAGPGPLIEERGVANQVAMKTVASNGWFNRLVKHGLAGWPA